MGGSFSASILETEYRVVEQLRPSNQPGIPPGIRKGPRSSGCFQRMMNGIAKLNR